LARARKGGGQKRGHLGDKVGGLAKGGGKIIGGKKGMLVPSWLCAAPPHWGGNKWGFLVVLGPQAPGGGGGVW